MATARNSFENNHSRTETLSELLNMLRFPSMFKPDKKGQKTPYPSSGLFLRVRFGFKNKRAKYKGFCVISQSTSSFDKYSPLFRPSSHPLGFAAVFLASLAPSGSKRTRFLPSSIDESIFRDLGLGASEFDPVRISDVDDSLMVLCCLN